MQDYGGYGVYGGGYPPPPPPPQRPSFWRYVAVAVAAGALGAGAVVAVGHIGSSGKQVAALEPLPSSSAPPQVLPSQGTGGAGIGNQGGGLGSGSGGLGNGDGGSGSEGLSAADQVIYNKVDPGLVIINTSLNYQSATAAGTGMVLNPDGLVLTNNHVIENATSITATVLATGKTYPAKVLGYDETGDIAAIQLQGASGLHTIPVGDSATVKSGASVLAMGNAEGESVIRPAPGQVVAVNQSIKASDEGGVVATEQLHGMIKTNADIVSGDSGGALANSSGQVIGMNTAGNNGLEQPTGFAIPINTALSIVSEITASQASSTVTIGYPPFIGIFVPTSTSSSPQTQLQQQEEADGGLGGGIGGGGQQACYDNNADMQPPTQVAPAHTGTLVIGAICGSPAASAGLLGGDVITEVQGKAVSTPASLHTALAKFKPDDSVTLTWENLSGQTLTRTIKLAVGPPL
jgi:S1-C subfamily serine protease